MGREQVLRSLADSSGWYEAPLRPPTAAELWATLSVHATATDISWPCRYMYWRKGAQSQDAPRVSGDCEVRWVAFQGDAMRLAETPPRCVMGDVGTPWWVVPINLYYQVTGLLYDPRVYWHAAGMAWNPDFPGYYSGLASRPPFGRQSVSLWVTRAGEDGVTAGPIVLEVLR